MKRGQCRGDFQSGKTVSFAPLFDAYAIFKAKESVRLRFRAREALSAIPIRSQDISFSLRYGANGASRELPARTVKKGVFEVPFTPEESGEYWLVAVIRGALPGSIPAVQLDVLGLANRLVEAPLLANRRARSAKRKLARHL